MLCKVWLWAIFLALWPLNSFAQLTSYHFVNPIGMMYDLPVGETPGWSTGTWINIETGTANIWNAKASMTDSRNSNTYSYFADYEQITSIAEIGQALSESIAIAVEVPYENHNGGFMDDFVDHFHQWIGSDRFHRDVNPKFGNHFSVKTNGVEQLTSEHAQGAGNIKAKLKYWAIPWVSSIPGACDCGLAFSLQAKFPLQTREHGLSSGHNDYSGLVHFGFPIADNSGFWATSAVTKLGKNDTFMGWPQRSWLQMYEVAGQVGFDENWGLTLKLRYESPLMEKQYLNFTYTQTQPLAKVEERIASGYNALVDWRGSEEIGIFYRWGEGSRINFLFIEDWGIGDQDKSSDGLYINDAPDFAFMTQWHFTF